MKRRRITIGSLMIAVVVAALFSAALRYPDVAEFLTAALLTLIPMAAAYSIPFLVAPPGRRFTVAAWIASLWPLSIVASLHFAWAVCYGFLGHPPGPTDNGFWIDALAIPVLMHGLISLASTCATPLLANLDRNKKGEFPLPVFGVFFSWYVVVLVWSWDPVHAAWWWID